MHSFLACNRPLVGHKMQIEEDLDPANAKAYYGEESVMEISKTEFQARMGGPHRHSARYNRTALSTEKGNLDEGPTTTKSPVPTAKQEFELQFHEGHREMGPWTEFDTPEELRDRCKPRKGETPGRTAVRCAGREAFVAWLSELNEKERGMSRRKRALENAAHAAWADWSAEFPELAVDPPDADEILTRAILFDRLLYHDCSKCEKCTPGLKCQYQHDLHECDGRGAYINEMKRFVHNREPDAEGRNAYCPNMLADQLSHQCMERPTGDAWIEYLCWYLCKCQQQLKVQLSEDDTHEGLEAMYDMEVHSVAECCYFLLGKRRGYRYWWKKGGPTVKNIDTSIGRAGSWKRRDHRNDGWFATKWEHYLNRPLTHPDLRHISYVDWQLRWYDKQTNKQTGFEVSAIAGGGHRPRGYAGTLIGVNESLKPPQHV